MSVFLATHFLQPVLRDVFILANPALLAALFLRLGSLAQAVADLSRRVSLLEAKL